MTLIQFSSDDQTITLPLGVTTATVFVQRHDCALVGQGMDLSTLVPDLTYQYAVLAGAPVGGAPSISAFRIADLTIDCDDLAGLAVVLPSGGFDYLEIERVRIVNHYRQTIAILNTSYIRLRDCEIAGNGGGFQLHSGAVGQDISGLTIWGCRWAFIVSDLGLVGQIPGGLVEDMDAWMDYWANPLGEQGLEATAFSATYVDVDSHVTNHRNLYDVVRVLTPVTTFTVGDPLPGTLAEWDRVEVADGRWTQVVRDEDTGELVLQPWRRAGQHGWVTGVTGTATAYRLTLGRLYGYTATRLTIHLDAGAATQGIWYTVAGDEAATPAVTVGQRVDILRHGYTGDAVAVRDVDIGGIQANRSLVSCKMRRIRIRGTFSDSNTQRGVFCVCEDIDTSMGQDMGHTVDAGAAPQLLINCTAATTGFHGFVLISGASTLVGCAANDNGKHGIGYGVAFDEYSHGSTVDAVCADNTTDGIEGEHRKRSVGVIGLLRQLANRILA